MHSQTYYLMLQTHTQVVQFSKWEIQIWGSLTPDWALDFHTLMPGDACIWGPTEGVVNRGKRKCGKEKNNVFL